ncbi:Uncharacterised protein [uncultured archaeon]|nr:Uncharacterised protein [uncultured archaeon]
MAAEQVDYTGELVGNLNAKMHDIEDKQKVMKDRLLLIGQNLIETKESTSQKILEIKKDIDILKQSVQRLTSFVETISSEFSKFAKKEDLEILTKQAKMFQPMDFVRKSDLEKSRKY